ncbi:hypothetical protein [Nocardia africana]
MSVHPSPKNLARDVVRQVWPKRQPRRPRAPKEFPESVKGVMLDRSGGLCELDSCGPVQVYHHRRPRGSGGSSVAWVNRAANGLALSDNCHLKVEGRLRDSSRTRSFTNGWLVSMNGNATAAETPVLYRGRWVNLTDDGEVHPIGGDA